MAETYNINAHYTNNPKAERPFRPIAQGPETLPYCHLYNDIDARKRISSINNDIYEYSQKEKKRSEKNFIKTFIALVVATLGILGLLRFFKKS